MERGHKVSLHLNWMHEVWSVVGIVYRCFCGLAENLLCRVLPMNVVLLERGQCIQSIMGECVALNRNSVTFARFFFVERSSAVITTSLLLCSCTIMTIKSFVRCGSSIKGVSYGCGVVLQQV